MTERKGRIEEYTPGLKGTTFYVCEDGSIGMYPDIGIIHQEYLDADRDRFKRIISQGNAFYDRESAELAAKKRAAMVKFERMDKLYEHNANQHMTEEDMELLK